MLKLIENMVLMTKTPKEKFNKLKWEINSDFFWDIQEKASFQSNSRRTKHSTKASMFFKKAQ